MLSWLLLLLPDDDGRASEYAGGGDGAYEDVSDDGKSRQNGKRLAASHRSLHGLVRVYLCVGGSIKATQQHDRRELKKFVPSLSILHDSLLVLRTLHILIAFILLTCFLTCHLSCFVFSPSFVVQIRVSITNPESRT